MRPSWTASAASAISISFRTAASGSPNGLGSANFTGFVLDGDVGDVDQGILEAVAVEGFAAGALPQRTRFLRRKPLTGLAHRIFSRGPISLVTPGLKFCFGPVRKKHPPSVLEIGAGLVEGGGRAILLLARMRPGIETATPSPRIFVMRNAAADRDRTGVHIPLVNVPAFLGGVSRTAARVSSGMRH